MPSNPSPALSPRDVLYEDNHLLVISKPVGVATMGALPGIPTIHSMAAAYLKQKYDKPGNVYVGIVSRLDSMTTGTLVLARTSKSASRLTLQFSGAADQSSQDTRSRTMKKSNKKASAPAQKLYLVAVEGTLPDTTGQTAGTLTDSLRKEDAARRMRICGSSHPDGQLAKLDYVTLATTQDTTLLAVRLLTGRKHQIRVQFADRGHPVLGDSKYVSSRKFSQGVALHSWQLLITHPTRDVAMRFVAGLPDSWSRFADIVDRESTRQAVSQNLNWNFDCPANRLP